MTDDDRIRALWAAMALGWNKADGQRFAESFAEDCDFTTVRGESPEGRAGIAAGHDTLFRTAYAGTSLDARVRAIRHLRPGLATVHAESTVITASASATGPEPRALVSTHALAVVERRDGHWLIVAFHNMVPVAPPPDA